MDQDPPRQVTDEERLAHENERWNDAWMEFVSNGDSSALAEYLRLGGPVTDQVREALITYLDANPVKQVGGSKKFRDFEVLVHVQGEQLRDKLNNLALQRLGDPPKKIRSVRAILEAYARDTNQELRTVEKQYQRGKTIFSGKQEDT
jgi:hypothetical protein